MGTRGTMSGYIQEMWYVRGTDEAIRRLHRHNRRVIRSLPLEDEWPFLTRTMFAGSPPPATYRGPVLHFGGSFKGSGGEWDGWREKFEALLRRLYWEHAFVVLRTEYCGEYVYLWDALCDDFTADSPKPIQDWVFCSGPLALARPQP